MDDVVKATRLTDRYPNANSDFYGSGLACIYKSGPSWPVCKGPEAQGIVRELRPVIGHAIGSKWLSIGQLIYESLDSIHVKWTSIDPLAYANEGEARPFCPLIVSVGVEPQSLLYDNAVAAADGVKRILAEAGFPDVEVAFVESTITRSVAAGPKLLSFNPTLDDVLELRKPFTTILGLAIAPLTYPHYEGTVALYFRLGKDTKRTAMLTCAHVACPPPAFPNNTGVTQPRTSKEIVALGNKAYGDSVKAMMGTIGDLLTYIEAWNDVIESLGEPEERENSKVTARRQEHIELVEKATKTIEQVNKLHDEVTKRRTIPDQRTIGYVLHSEKIEVLVEPHKFTKDWALIELYDEKIDWPAFKGNKIYIGGNLSISDFRNTMYPNAADRKDYRYPQDGLLQAYGVVQDAEIRNPQNLEANGDKCLFVVKNGMATGTTVGRANGLESFTRYYPEYGIKHTSVEMAVMPYDKKHGKFSDAGDSGSIVLARDGRIVGILTGSRGPADETDVTYLTPYWWIEEQIKSKYPGCYLYEVVQ
ncbi:uncharacterized protein FOMMEDRAFT_119956 [Fomitiporia mediterranea MF3/22]|uniref:uncharacterized protein n=1 Tax=Fomitiporia mediterranea (strain MF3/22) TaxID=694068 RepID=UPI0004407954|nr:uncharacterized protein FOMMEDRAFT_119956 [Fomitiporia mediterranea MF3/22]EJD04750.1 hypothetical protein FOMMEDRAFT_119956 [Fomitiporia mediterranea MF3/22]